LARTQKRKVERKGLWEIRFILSGLPLPEDEVIVNDKLRFAKLSGKEENLRLPARGYVKVIGKRAQVNSIAERYLKDFIGLYSNMVRSVIRIIRDDGASELPSRFVPPGTKYLGAMSRTVRLFMGTSRRKEELNKSLRLTAKMMEAIDLDRKSMTFLRIALDYFLTSKTTEEKDDKLISCMIAIEALFGEKDELKYRISHRVACLLGENDDSREDVFNKMKDLYDKRSDLVHGRETIVSWDDIKKIQAYLRNSIDCFLVLSQRYSRGRFLQALDNAVVNNKKRKELQEECEKLLHRTRKAVN